MRSRLLVLALIGLAACSSASGEDTGATADELTGFSAKAVTTTLAYGGHTESLSVPPKTVTAVKFTGVAGDEVEAWVKHWGNGTAVLIGPDGRKKLAGADPAANYGRDSRVRFTLTRSGTHYVAFRTGNGTDSVVIHLEKRGGVLPPSSPAASTDPCIAHPWPMMGQCRDAGYRSNVEGPLTAALAWSTPFGFTGWDALEGIAVGRNGTTHLLHGPRSYIMGNEALVYSAVDAAGRKVLSERLDLGDLFRPSLALAPDGTPYVLNAFAVANGTQKGLYDRELFRIDPHGVATSVGNLRQPGQLLRDGWDENSTRRILPLLRMDAQGRPYVRTYVENLNGSSPYLGNTVRFDPTTNRTDLVQPADSGEVAGSESHILVPSGGLLELSGNYLKRTDAAGKHMWMISAAGGIVAADFAHDHIFVRSQSDDHRSESPPWHQWNVYSVTTGKLLWKTTSHGWLLRVPIFHPNGDAVFHAGKDSFDGSFEIWSADGVQKAAVPMGATNWFPDFALDGAGNTYAVLGKHLVGVDATGALRIDLTMPESGNRIALGPDHTLLVASGTRLMAFR